MLKNLKRLWKQLKCKHETAWDFYPSDTAYKDHAMKGGLKIKVCWKCGAVLDVENYSQ